MRPEDVKQAASLLATLESIKEAHEEPSGRLVGLRNHMPFGPDYPTSIMLSKEQMTTLLNVLDCEARSALRKLGVLV